MLSLEGSVITIDAMGTQTAIAEKIVDGGAGYILALKGNQGTLLQDVRLMENEVLPMSELHTPHPQPLFLFVCFCGKLYICNFKY